MWLTQWLLTAHYVSRLHPFHRRLRAFLAEAPLLSASAKNRCGIRVDRLRPTACLCFPPTPLRLHLQSQTIFDGYVHAFAATPPASGRWHASTPLSTRNIRLLFRAVDDGLRHFLLHSRLSHTVSHVPPTHRGRSRQHSKPPGTFLSFIVCDAMPTPGPDARCADALTPLRRSANHFAHSESAYGLGQGQAGLLSAVQASSTESLSLRASATPAVCSNPM